jgi:hypothetical protein
VTDGIHSHRLALSAAARRLDRLFQGQTVDRGYIGCKGPLNDCLVIRGFQQKSHFMMNFRPIELGAPIVDATLPAGMSIPEVEMAGYVPPQIALPGGWRINHVVERSPPSQQS